MYCGIIIFRGEPTFVVSWVTLAHEFTSPQTYINICLMFIEIITELVPTKLRPHETGTFWVPTNIEPQECN